MKTRLKRAASACRCPEHLNSQRFHLTLYAGTGFIMRMMSATATHSSRTVHRLIALALVLWLGGMGCLVGCEMNVSAATVSEAQASASKTSCPAFSGADCCRHAQSDGAQAIARTAPQSDGAMSCCPLAGHSSLVARKPYVGSPSLALAASAVLPAPKIETYITRAINQLPAQDRGGTYLLYCVFLI